MFPSFEVFGRTIGMYGVMVVLGFAACVLMCIYLRKKKNIPSDSLLFVGVAIGVGAFIGGHIVYGITNIDILYGIVTHLGSLSFEQIIALLGYAVGGMVYYGGFLGGIVAILIYCKFSKKLNSGDTMDVYAVCVPLFHVFGRIGCFLGGCCYGIESEFGFTVHNNTINPSVNDVNRLPVQLFEAGCNVLIFLVMLWLFKKCILEKRLIFIYMLIYPVARFILEFFRGDTYRGFLFGLSTSQIISIILFAVSAIYLIVYFIGRNKHKTE